MEEVNTKAYPDVHQDSYSKTIFGFWLYLFSDFIMFASLFAVYAVLRTSHGSESLQKHLMSLPFSFFQAVTLFLASFSSGIAGVFTHKRKKNPLILWWAITFFFGALFFVLQMKEFSYLVQGGNTWAKNAFFSIYFTIVATHMLHVFFALVWIVVLLIPLRKSLIHLVEVKRFICLKMFWQFLNVVWVFIFTIIYLMK